MPVVHKHMSASCSMKTSKIFWSSISREHFEEGKVYT